MAGVEKEKRTENIKVRLTPSEKKQLEKLIEEHGVKNLSEFIRSIILTGSYKVTSEDYSDLLYEVNKIGINLNQIAKYANIEKELDIKILKELAKIREQLDILIE